MTFKKPEMEKNLRNGLSMSYEWNGSPEPHIVGFRDLVVTGIAPVSKKTAVKATSKCQWLEWMFHENLVKTH